MSLQRTIGALLVFGFLLSSPIDARAQRCERPAAEALAEDASRATLWNWGWGTLYATSALAGAGLAVAADVEDRKLALWVGALKSTIGVAYQLVNPIRIEGPRADCGNLDAQLARAAEIERRRHGWFPRAGSIALNSAAFAYVLYETDNYFLAGSGAVLGLIAGELAVWTSPNEIRSGGLGVAGLHFIPQVDSHSQGIALIGAF